VTHAPSALVCTVAEEYRALTMIVDRLPRDGCGGCVPCVQVCWHHFWQSSRS